MIQAIYHISWTKKQLKFNFDAKTSRGTLTEHNCYIIRIALCTEPKVFGLGEASPLKGLSPDYGKNFEKQLIQVCDLLSHKKRHSSTVHKLISKQFPSLRFAFESALLDLEQGGQQVYFPQDKMLQNPTPINGLIWMGDIAFMQKQIEQKLKQGFNCLKLKVGSLDFEQEYALVKSLRSRFDKSQLILRLDANGGYSFDEALERLKQWSQLDIHSIEQPIPAGNIKKMAKLCAESPLPIALDEELIGINNKSQQFDLINKVQPSFLVLKPTLLGGFQATKQWIDLAEALSIQWWITSALESNIGLTAISQFVAQFQPKCHQGLGTGQLYSNNFDTKLAIRSGYLYS